jgi:hypothetical protein
MFWKNHDSTAKTSKQVCRLSQKRLTWYTCAVVAEVVSSVLSIGHCHEIQ